MIGGIWDASFFLLDTKVPMEFVRPSVPLGPTVQYCSPTGMGISKDRILCFGTVYIIGVGVAGGELESQLENNPVSKQPR